MQQMDIKCYCLYLIRLNPILPMLCIKLTVSGFALLLQSLEC